jgi:hypothetical protein
MNPNDPNVSRALAKLKNYFPMEPEQLLELARGSKDLPELRKNYAKENDLKLKGVPKLP